MMPGANAFLGIYDELTNRFGRDYAAALENLEDGANSDLDRLLAELTEAELDFLLTTIRARRGLLSIGAAYGNEVVATSKQILAFGGAGIGLAAAFLQRLSEVPPFILKTVAVVALFYGNLILLSLYIIFSFSWQARFRYPFLYFKRIGNTVPFFYYQAISPDTPRSLFQTKDEKGKAAMLYATDLVKFVRYHVDSVKSEQEVAPDSADDSSPVRPSLLRAKRRIVRDEIQQYFLVVSYQGYVNQFEIKMNNHFLYGIIGAIAGALLIAGVMFFR
jgi:hypothetical protein